MSSLLKQIVEDSPGFTWLGERGGKGCFSMKTPTDRKMEGDDAKLWNYVHGWSDCLDHIKGGGICWNDASKDELPEHGALVIAEDGQEDVRVMRYYRATEPPWFRYWIYFPKTREENSRY